MTSSLSFAELLVDNLKALNAKERDHLMRFAYLGDPGEYQDTQRWLSQSMTTALQSQLVGTKLEGKTPCVFAAMDYHLDWVHAALTLTYLNIPVSEANQKTPYLCDPLATCGNEDATLRPVSGRQEDVDLLVAFADADEVVLLFIEAKGVAAVDKNQLARKLIRIDRILESSGALECPQLTCKFVLIAPAQSVHPEPSLCSIWKLASECTSPIKLSTLIQSDIHKNGIGNSVMSFVPLEGFPKSLQKVTRIGPADTVSGEKFTQWKITKRNVAKQNTATSKM